MSIQFANFVAHRCGVLNTLQREPSHLARLDLIVPRASLFKWSEVSRKACNVVINVRLSSTTALTTLGNSLSWLRLSAPGCCSCTHPENEKDDCFPC
jgi:hypothetical protein